MATAGMKTGKKRKYVREKKGASICTKLISSSSSFREDGEERRRGEEKGEYVTGIASHFSSLRSLLLFSSLPYSPSPPKAPDGLRGKRKEEKVWKYERSHLQQRKRRKEEEEESQRNIRGSEVEFMFLNPGMFSSPSFGTRGLLWRWLLIIILEILFSFWREILKVVKALF